MTAPNRHGDVVDFEKLIRVHIDQRPIPTDAVECKGRLGAGGWRSVRLGCSNSSDHVVKGLWRHNIRTHDRLPAGRTIFNEQAAARLAISAQVPVPRPELVRISARLIDAHSDAMGHLQPGLAHGSKFINFGPSPPERLAMPDARSRLADLATFIRWTGGSDYELLACPGDGILYLVDLGNFFGGPDWIGSTLAAGIEDHGEREFANLVRKFNLGAAEILAAQERRRAVTPEQLSKALAVPPECWGVGLDERAQLAEILYQRRLIS